MWSDVRNNIFFKPFPFHLIDMRWKTGSNCLINKPDLELSVSVRDTGIISPVCANGKSTQQTDEH